MEMMTVTGTKHYMAPELFAWYADHKMPTYDKSVDVFSLGVTSFTLLESKKRIAHGTSHK